MELRDFFKIILRHRFVIIVMCLSSVVTATSLTYVLSERFRSQAMIMIRPQKSLELVPQKEEMLKFPVSDYTPIETTSKTYSEIIKSRTVAEKVVTLLDLAAQPEVEESGWRALLRRAKVKARDILMKTWNLLKYGRIEEEDPFNRIVTEVQGGLSVKPTKETYLFELQAEAKSPQLASAIANAAAKVFVDYLADLSALEKKEALHAHTAKIEAARKQLDRSRNAVVEFKRSAGLVSPQKEISLELEALSKLEVSQEALSAKIRGVLARKESISRQLAEYERFSKSTTKVADNPLYRQLSSDLAKKEIELAGLSKRFTAEHRAVKSLQAEIDEIKEKLKGEVPTLTSEETLSLDPIHQSLSNELVNANVELEALKAEHERADRAILEKKRLISQLPQKETDLSRLELLAVLNEDTYKLVSKHYEEVELATGRETPYIQIVQPAHTPLYPFRPIKVYHAGLAAILSLIVGIGVALLLEQVNTTIRSVDEAERGLSLPVLMTVPQLALGSEASASLSPLPAHFAEHIRGLRSFFQIRYEQDGGVFLITSPGRHAGKSLLAATVAVSLAETDRKVALIDANLRNPNLHLLFGLSDLAGISDILDAEGAVTWESVKPLLRFLPSGLCVVTSGKPTDAPSTLLSLDNLPQLIAVLKSEFDFIFFDSAALLAGPDSALIAPHADGTVIVLDCGVTTIHEGRRATQILETGRAKILGVVLNKHPDTTPFYA
jgi:capsular exopolysaccharide synthesis family protein